jgi:KUP system potassium uptake protein
MRRRLPERLFLRKLAENPPVRLPGTGIVLTPATAGIPLSLTHHLKHNRVLHERLLLVAVLTTEAPRVPEAQRVEVVDLACGISRVIVRYGFMESPDVPGALRQAVAEGKLADVDPREVTYYLGRETIIPTKRRRGMAVWREQLYALLSRNAERSAAYFCCPARQVVEIGTELEI